MTGVAHRQRHPFAARHRIAAETRRVQRAGRDRESPAARHRVAGVDHEIDDHLLDLRAVGVDRRQVGRRAQRELDVLTDEAPQQARELGDDGVEIQPRRLQDLFAAEGEQLLSERGRPLPGLLNLHQIRPIRIRFGAVADEQLGVAENGRQQVVEIVRDAAGKPSNALDLLRLRQTLFEQAAIGDVACDAQMAIAMNANAITAFDEPRAVRARHDAMLAFGYPERQQLAPGGHERIAGLDQEVVERPMHETVVVEAEQGARGRIGFANRAVVVENQHRVGGVQEHGAELPRALDERRLGLDVRGDVDHESRELDELAAGEFADAALDHVDEDVVAAS